jgi:signal transduction histidine kinase
MSTLATGFKSRHDGSRAAATLLLVTASVTRDGTGTTSGLVCLCADMTAECERLMAEASRAQVEAINDAKDKFLACMSHEMRTPLSALIGLLQLVVAKSASEWSHQVLSPFVTSSLKSAEHLYVLVSDVLDMSKVQHGKLSLNIREFDLRETMESVAGRCRHVLSAVESSKRHVDLVVNIAPTELRVLTGDAQRIQQIITNLGTNAIKYTMHGHVTIDVNLRPLSPTECEGCEPNLWNEAAEYLPRCGARNARAREREPRSRRAVHLARAGAATHTTHPRPFLPPRPLTRALAAAARRWS